MHYSFKGLSISFIFNQTQCRLNLCYSVFKQSHILFWRPLYFVKQFKEKVKLNQTHLTTNPGFNMYIVYDSERVYRTCWDNHVGLFSQSSQCVCVCVRVCEKGLFWNALLAHSVLLFLLYNRSCWNLLKYSLMNDKSMTAYLRTISPVLKAYSL